MDRALFRLFSTIESGLLAVKKKPRYR